MQEKNTRLVKEIYDVNFFDRLQSLYPDLNKSEIAEVLDIGPSAITPYVKGRLPGLAILVRIAEEKQVSLHWLIKGSGPRERLVIEAIKDGQVDVEQIRNNALIDHHLAEARRLGSEEKARGKSKQLKRAVNGS